MIRRIRDAAILLVAGSNAHHLAVLGLRAWVAHRSRAPARPR